MLFVPAVDEGRICRKVKLVPGLRLRVRAFTRLKWMTDDFLLLQPNNKAKTLGSLCGRNYSKLVIFTRFTGERVREMRY